MKKLLAVISSIAVCASAVAVSVLSYFPSPVKVGAEAPDTSSLVVTDMHSNASIPVVTFTQSSLLNATSNIDVSIEFCPTGWGSSNSLVSPLSYGSISHDNGFFTFTFRWEYALHRFDTSAVSHFGSNLSGKKLFSYLYLATPLFDVGVQGHDIVFSSRCPSNNPFNFTNYLNYGSAFSPTAGGPDVRFDLSGWVGNDMSLWLSSQGYTNGHQDGYLDGYDEGESFGHSTGYNDGLSDGTRNFGMWDLFSNAFGSVGNILGIQLFPGLSIGLLVSVPIAFAFILWLIHVLKG